MEWANTIIVGGGPAGLAVAATLQRRGLPATVLEKADSVAPAWRRHYDRLHLHTHKAASSLPGMPMPASYPRYPSRDQVAAYLDTYADEEHLDVRLDVGVLSCNERGGTWEVRTEGAGTVMARSLVIATGLNEVPNLPDYPRTGLFAGEILHSAEYRNGSPWRGERALVVGFGNSAGEIALDLTEHGAETHLSVRSPSVVVPRDIAGIPVLTIARWLSVFPPRFADKLSKPLLRVLIGDISKVAVPSAGWGPMEQIARFGKIPLLDVGTMKALRQGAITARPGIERFIESGVVFEDGSSGDFAVVVLATGYRPGVMRILEDTTDLLDQQGRPLVSGGVTARAGLYFCGFREAPTGRLREIGIEAERIASLIAADVGSERVAS